MLIVAGSGVGERDFSKLPKNIELSEFDTIICDKSFVENRENTLKLSYLDARDYILQNYQKETILYVVTGSPLFFSAGTAISKYIPKNHLKIVPNTSSKDYILSHLAISEREVETISIHGKKDLDLEKFLKNRFTIILTDYKSLDILLNATQYLNSKDLRWIIGYKMGYKDEFIGEFNPRKHNFNLENPYLIMLERLFKYPKLSLKDEDFKTERGVITKEYKRNFTLQLLNLYPNLIFWDIGAGSGSCSIEAFRKYRVKTHLFEKSPRRVSFIKENLKRHRVCESYLFEGDVNIFLEDRAIPNPDRVFIGGGGDEVIKKIPYIFKRLNSSGIILIVAITLKSLNSIINTLEKNRIEFETISINITNFTGKLKMSEAQRELFIFKVVK